MDFLSTIHSSVVARLISGEMGLAQTARGRKLKKGSSRDILQIDPWRRKGLQKAKAGHNSKSRLRGKYFLSAKETKDIANVKRYQYISILFVIFIFIFWVKENRNRRQKDSDGRSNGSSTISKFIPHTKVKNVGNTAT